jgi:hypothetical protein
VTSFALIAATSARVRLVSCATAEEITNSAREMAPIPPILIVILLDEGDKTTLHLYRIEG